MQGPPFFETIKIAFLYFTYNWQAIAKTYWLYLSIYFIHIALALTTNITSYFEIEMPLGSGPTRSISYLLYFAAVLPISISIQKNYILGSTPEQSIRLTRLKKNEKQYILGFILFLIIIVAIYMPFTVLSVITEQFNPTLAKIIHVIGAFIVIWITLRSILFFPAKAAAADISFKQAFKLSKNLILSLSASLAIIIATTAVLLAITGGIIDNTLGLVIGPLDSFEKILIFSFLTALALLPIQIASLITSLAIIARYYIWAVQERTT